MLFALRRYKYWKETAAPLRKFFLCCCWILRGHLPNPKTADKHTSGFSRGVRGANLNANTHTYTQEHVDPAQPGMKAVWEGCFSPGGGLWDHKKCVLSESRKQRGWSAADPGSCSCVTLLVLPKKKRKRDTRRETTAAFSSRHPQLACPLCQNTRTLAIYQETQIDACSPPSFLREQLATHGCSYFKVHNGFTLKKTCLRVLRNVLQSHSWREMSPLHTNALNNPHGLNLRVDTGWSAARRESRRLSCIQASVCVFRFHFAVRPRRAGGDKGERLRQFVQTRAPPGAPRAHAPTQIRHRNTCATQARQREAPTSPHNEAYLSLLW